MHENRNLFLFLIEINNMYRTRHVTNTQDQYLAPMQTVQPVRCFVTSVSHRSYCGGISAIVASCYDILLLLANGVPTIPSLCPVFDDCSGGWQSQQSCDCSGSVSSLVQCYGGRSSPSSI